MKRFVAKLGRRKAASSFGAASDGYRVVSTADVDGNGSGSSRVLEVDDDFDDLFVRGREPGSGLERNLSLPTLVFLSVSNTVGTGIYVLTGIASTQYAGQYVSVSYLLAAIACFFSAFCFAEFAARVKSSAGSSYSFAYYSLGELVAYFLGWMIFIGTLAGIAANAVVWSGYFDAFTGYAIRNYTTNVLHLTWNLPPPFSSHLDVLAVLVLVFLFLISLIGLELTTLFNNCIAAINIVVLLLISICGLIYGDVKNLTEVKYENGVNGVIKGASIVMYAYFGFESSTFAIEEAINPTRNIPLSLILSLVLITLIYCGAGLSLNLMQPYNTIDTDSSYPSAFKSVGWMHATVSVGPILGLTGALIISIYSLQRIIFAMSKDGLLFEFLARIHPRTKVPHLAALVSFVITLLLVVFIDMKALIGFVDVSGFLTYSSVACGLLVVRYSIVDGREAPIPDDDDAAEDEDALMAETSLGHDNCCFLDGDDPTPSRLTRPAPEPRLPGFFQNKFYATLLIAFIYFFNMAISIPLNLAQNYKTPILVIMLSANVLLAVLLSLFHQANTRTSSLSFKVPLVPFLPILVIVLNNYLMMSCDVKDWIMFGIVMLTGLPIYLFYGMSHSKLEERRR